MKRAGVVMAMARVISREKLPTAAAEAAMEVALELMVPSHAELMWHFHITAPDHADEIVATILEFFRERLA